MKRYIRSSFDLDTTYRVTYHFGKNGDTYTIENKGLLNVLNYITEWCYENDQQAVILKIEQVGE